MKLKAKVISVLCLLLFIFGCKDKKRNVVKVETQAVTLSLPVVRYDREVSEKSASIQQFNAWHRSQLANDPFYKLWLPYVMQLPPDTTAVVDLYRLATFRDYKDLQKVIDSVFTDITPYKTHLEEVFKRYKVLFPQKSSPKLYFYNSFYSVGIFPDTNMIGIGLEWFIGSEHWIVNALPVEKFPRYMRRHMEPHNLVPYAVKGWLDYNFLPDKPNQKLIEHMVNKGKVIYAAEAGMPEIPDSVLMNYTASQMAWCYDNEEKIWKEMVKGDVLYSSKQNNIVRFMVDGPFTNGFPKESSPRLGHFIGWQMVADYMEKHPDTPLDKLMRQVSADEILKSYKAR